MARTNVQEYEDRTLKQRALFHKRVSGAFSRSKGKNSELVGLLLPLHTDGHSFP